MRSRLSWQAIRNQEWKAQIRKLNASRQERHSVGVQRRAMDKLDRYLVLYVGGCAVIAICIIGLMRAETWDSQSSNRSSTISKPSLTEPNTSGTPGHKQPHPRRGSFVSTRLGPASTSGSIR